MYDVAIIGAGPAGATLARLLGTRYRTLLVDRRRLDSPYRPGALGKPCGGLLAPAAQAELARQGLGMPASVIAGPQLFAVRTLDLPARLEQLYQRFYINVDREAFDRWLLSLVPPQVDTALGWSLTSVDSDEAGPFLRFRTPGGGRAGVRARIVIGADGASSSVRRLVFADKPAPRHYAGVQAAFTSDSADPYYGAVFDAGLTDYYGWTIPKGDHVLAGVALPSGQSAAERFDEFVSRLRARGFHLGAEVARSASAIARPSWVGQICPGAGNVLLAGEAAGFISPSSAEGISYALSSATALAHALRPGLAGAAGRYRIAAGPIAARVCAKGAKASAIYGPSVRRLVMRSGLGAIAPAQIAWCPETASCV